MADLAGFCSLSRGCSQAKYHPRGIYLGQGTIISRFKEVRRMLNVSEVPHGVFLKYLEHRLK